MNAPDLGGGGDRPRPQLIDEYLPTLKELVQRSDSKLRGDVAHDNLLAFGYLSTPKVYLANS